MKQASQGDHIGYHPAFLDTEIPKKWLNWIMFSGVTASVYWGIFAWGSYRGGGCYTAHVTAGSFHPHAGDRDPSRSERTPEDHDSIALTYLSHHKQEMKYSKHQKRALSGPGCAQTERTPLYPHTAPKRAGADSGNKQFCNVLTDKTVSTGNCKSLHTLAFTSGYHASSQRVNAQRIMSKTKLQKDIKGLND